MRTKKAAESLAKRPQENRRNSGRAVSIRKDGDKGAGVNTPIIGGSGFHILEKQLKSISVFELELLKGSNEKFTKYMLSMVNTEAKQLDVIVDLYLIMKAQTKYKNAKEPVWKETTQPMEVLSFLLRRLGVLAKGEDWSIDPYVVDGKRRFQFVVHKTYSTIFIKPIFFFFPVDFLPLLKNRDLPLHDLIIDAVALISRNCKIPLWDEDGDYSTHLSKLTSGEYDISNNRIIERQKLMYSNGPAAAYLERIKSKRKTVTQESILKQVQAYKITSNRKVAIINWITNSIKVALLHGQIKDFTFIPGCIPNRERSITPYRNYKFVWSTHNNDVLFSKARKTLKSDSEAAGDFSPCIFTMAKPGQILKPLNVNPFPIQLSQWMDWGIGIFTRTHQQYFYKNQKHQNTSVGDTMMETIEIQEIHEQ